MGRELIRIGEGVAQIVDLAGRLSGDGYVGRCNLIADSPYVALNDDRKTSFLFASYEAACELLLAPLNLACWTTLDVT